MLHRAKKARTLNRGIHKDKLRAPSHLWHAENVCHVNRALDAGYAPYLETALSPIETYEPKEADCGLKMPPNALSPRWRESTKMSDLPFS